MSGEVFNPEASQEQIATATADNPNAADIVQQELSSARENMSPDDYNSWLTQMQHGADGEGGPEQGVDPKVWGMVEFYDSTLNENSQYKDAPLPGGTPEDPGRVLQSEKTPGQDGQERPTLVVAEDGTSTGVHYSEQGQIDAYNQTLPDGSHRQYRQGEDGQWAVFDGEGKPLEEPANVSQAFVDKEGNFVTVHNGADNQPGSIAVGEQRYERGPDGKWNVPGASGNVTEVTLDENHQVTYKTEDGRTVTNVADGTEQTVQPDGLTVHREKPGGEPIRYEKDGSSFRRDDDGEWWYHNDKDGGKQVSIGTPRVDEESGEVKADETGWSLGKDVVLG